MKNIAIKVVALSLTLSAAKPVFAQGDISDKVEAYKKELQAAQKRHEAVVKGNELDWQDLVEGTPKVVEFTFLSNPGLALTGPYFGYMFSQYVELGLDSQFSYNTTTHKGKGENPAKVIQTTQSYFFGPRLTASLPLNSHLVLIMALSPGIYGDTDKTTTKAQGADPTTVKTVNGPAFKLLMMPLGIGFRFNQLEFRTGMVLSYATGSSEWNADPDASYSNFLFQHASGLLQIRHYF